MSEESAGRGGGHLLGEDPPTEEKWKSKPFEVVFRERFGGETPEEAVKQALETLSRVAEGKELAQFKVLRHMKDPEHPIETKAYFYLIRSDKL